MVVGAWFSRNFQFCIHITYTQQSLSTKWSHIKIVMTRMNNILYKYKFTTELQRSTKQHVESTQNPLIKVNLTVQLTKAKCLSLRWTLLWYRVITWWTLRDELEQEVWKHQEVEWRWKTPVYLLIQQYDHNCLYYHFL